MRKFEIKFNKGAAMEGVLREIKFDGVNKVHKNYETESRGAPRVGGNGYVSKPGDAANIDTGALNDSVEGDIKNNTVRISAGGTAEVPYARRLEEEYNRPNIKTLMPGLLDNAELQIKINKHITRNIKFL